MLRIPCTPRPTRGEILRRAKAMPTMRDVHKVGWQVLSMLRGAFAQQTAPRAESKGVPSEGKTILSKHCKGKCEDYKYSRKGRHGMPRLSADFARCRTCDVYIKWDGIHCPCCTVKVSRTARGKCAKIQRVRKEQAGLIKRY